jgi:hypothetical protein
MSLLRKNRFFTLGILMAPVSLWIGIYSAGFGHGDYVAARLVLPFACVSMGKYFGADFVVTTLALLQWPAYGFLSDKSAYKVWTLVTIIVAHGSLCWWLFRKGSENFR